MQRLGRATLGLWVFTLGILGWIFPNVGQGNLVNVATNGLLLPFGVLAAVGLPRAVDGIGTGPLRWGLGGIAACQLLQNLVTAATGLGPVNATPVIAVILACVALLIGVKRWQEDAWDESATPWVAGAFAGFAFEPLYYMVLGIAGGSLFGPFFPGALLVAIGGALAAWGFYPDLDADSTEPAAPVAAKPAKGRRARA
jgi:hypothetical protein